MGGAESRHGDPLTARQQEVWNWWRGYQARHFGIPPSFRKACAALGIASTNGIRDHLLAIAKKGWMYELTAADESKTYYAAVTPQELDDRRRSRATIAP